MAFVQSTSAVTASATSLAAPAISVTAGNAIWVGWGGGTGLGAETISDGTNTYNNDVAAIDNGTDATAGVRSAINVAGGSTTVTQSGGGSNARTIQVREYSGWTAFDKSSSGQAFSTSINSGSTATTTQADEELVGFAFQGNGASAPYSSIGSFGNLLNVDGTKDACSADRIVAATGAYAFTATSSSIGNFIAVIATYKLTLPTYEQEGARFRNDDGSETTATWAASQDTDITAPLGTNLRLRTLVNAGNGADPPANAYTLYRSKNGGAYSAVPIASTFKQQPVIEAGDCTVSGTDTAQASWAVSHPAAVVGDLLIFNIAWDDSTSTTDATEPAGPNGETLSEINATPAVSNGTEVRNKSWYCIATGTWAASTVTFTPTATESWSATVIKVLAGEFDATTPIGASATRASAGTAETSALSPAITAGASDGSGTLIFFAAVDADPLSATPPTGFTDLQRQDLGAVAHGVCCRIAATTNSESIAGGDAWAIASDSWCSVGYIVRAPTVSAEVYMSASGNITAGGEATTFQLSAPAGKSTSDFVTGRMWDNENGTDTIDITTDDYTELEWCLIAQSPAANGDTYQFRVYRGSTVFNTYSVTLQWTIGSAVTVTIDMWYQPASGPCRTHPKVLASGMGDKGRVP